MKLDFETIQSLKLLAIHQGDLVGVKFIVEVFLTNGEKFRSFLLPPNYDLLRSIKDYEYDSAIIKHSYSEIRQSIKMTKEIEFKELLRRIKDM